MQIAFKTDIGLVRSSNQDALIISSDQRLFGVADGMGGHRGGNIASALAASTILSFTQGSEPEEDRLKKSIQAANEAIYTRQLGVSELSGMGTTVTVLWDAGENMLLGHVGDSRAYLFRNGMLRQLSVDHSVVRELVLQGVITEAEAKTHPYRHMITRAVGTDLDVEVDLLSVPREKDDTWLVCSDGLTEYLADDEICEGLLRESLERAVDWMVKTALERGGKDNISVVAARGAV